MVAVHCNGTVQCVGFSPSNFNAALLSLEGNSA